MASLLIVDDDYSLFALLAEFLGNSGFVCVHAPDGNAGLALLAEQAFDLVILDVMLPGKNGHDVLRVIRTSPPTQLLPVLMLTAKGEEEDKVTGLELGADDYLAKPFSAKELVARLQALLRRTRLTPDAAVQSEGPLCLGDLQIDASALTVRNGEQTLEITPSELRLLELFAKTPGTVIDRETLSLEILGHKPFPQDRGLDMMISRLRKKLGARPDGGERIRAARGQGYIFTVSGEN